MIRLRHSKLIFISGLVPLIVGFSLLRFGLNTLLQKNGPMPLLDFFSNLTGSVDGGAILLIALALGIGMLKGRMVMVKSAKRNFERILTLPDPAPITKVYTIPFYVMIVGMILMGQTLRASSCPLDIIGVVYAAVGSGLLQSGVTTIKNSFRVPKHNTQ